MPTLTGLCFLLLPPSLALYFQHLTEAPNSSIPLAVELIKISHEKVYFTHLTWRCPAQGSAEVKEKANHVSSAMQIP